MQLVQTASRRQVMQMGGQMIHSLSILGMSSDDLSDHLAEQAESNPYLKYRPPAAFAARGGESYDVVATVAADRPSLMAHVSGQIELAFDRPSDRLLALRIAEALEPTGWLAQDLDVIAMQAGVPLARAEGVLTRLQGFEPTGLFARNLSECLLLQAREADILTWELETLLTHLDLFAEGRMEELADLCDCEPADVPEIAAQIRGLDPKPGLAFDHVATPVFPPDLIATRGPEGWTVELNRATTPQITVQSEVENDAAETSAARKSRRKALAEAKALAQAIERRGDTLLRTAAVLVSRQTAFLEGGPAHLVPLTLEDVAAELGVHASTISRAVSGRMIQTQTRALPLRAFFSRPVSTGQGADVSRDKALGFVEETVRKEDPNNPLSDDAIVSLAQAAGLHMARRTVAKYRSTLGLGSSYARRRKAMAD